MALSKGEVSFLFVKRITLFNFESDVSNFLSSSNVFILMTWFGMNLYPYYPKLWGDASP